MNNQPERPLTLEHQFEIERCKIYLQENPEKAQKIAIAQLTFHLELVEECQRLKAENTSLKSLSLFPVQTPSHGWLQAEYDDLRSEYLKVLKENAHLRQDNKDKMQLIDALTKDDSLDSLTEDNILLPDFIEEVLWLL